MANGKKTFVRISNADIYAELKEMKKALYDHIEKNEKEHNELNNKVNVSCQEVRDINKSIDGRIENNKLISQAALALTIAVILGVIGKSVFFS